MANPVTSGKNVIRGTRLVGKAAPAVKKAAQTTQTVAQWTAYLRKNVKESELKDINVLDELSSMNPDDVLDKEQVMGMIKYPRVVNIPTNAYKRHFNIPSDEAYSESVTFVNVGDVGITNYENPYYIARGRPDDNGRMIYFHAAPGGRVLFERDAGVRTYTGINDVPREIGGATVYGGGGPPKELTGIPRRYAVQDKVAHSMFSDDAEISGQMGSQEGRRHVPLFWSINTYNSKERVYTVLEWQRDLRRGRVFQDEATLLANWEEIVNSLPQDYVNMASHYSDVVNLQREMATVYDMFADIQISLKDIKWLPPVVKGEENVEMTHLVRDMGKFDDLMLETLYDNLPDAMRLLGKNATVKDILADRRIMSEFQANLISDFIRAVRLEYASKGEADFFSTNVYPTVRSLKKAHRKITKEKEVLEGKLRYEPIRDEQTGMDISMYNRMLGLGEDRNEISKLPFDRKWNLTAFKIDLEQAIAYGAKKLRWSTGQAVTDRWGKTDVLDKRIKQYDKHIHYDIRKYFKQEFGYDVPIYGGPPLSYWEIDITDALKERLYRKGMQQPAWAVGGGTVGTGAAVSGANEKNKKLDPGIYLDEDSGKYFKIDKEGNMTEVTD